MVDPIGAKPVAAERRVSPVEAAVPAKGAPGVTAHHQETAIARGLSSAVTDLSSSPPVDSDRVSRIRQAIANQTYPIVAETIADRLIALKLNWNPHEQA